MTPYVKSTSSGQLRGTNPPLQPPVPAPGGLGGLWGARCPAPVPVLAHMDTGAWLLPPQISTAPADEEMKQRQEQQSAQGGGVAWLPEHPPAPEHPFQVPRAALGAEHRVRPSRAVGRGEAGDAGGCSQRKRAAAGKGAAPNPGGQQPPPPQQAARILRVRAAALGSVADEGARAQLSGPEEARAEGASGGAAAQSSSERYLQLPQHRPCRTPASPLPRSLNQSTN